jgi:hypothetical protein
VPSSSDRRRDQADQSRYTHNEIGESRAVRGKRRCEAPPQAAQGILDRLTHARTKGVGANTRRLGFRGPLVCVSGGNGTPSRAELSLEMAGAAVTQPVGASALPGHLTCIRPHHSISLRPGHWATAHSQQLTPHWPLATSQTLYEHKVTKCTAPRSPPPGPPAPPAPLPRHPSPAPPAHLPSPPASCGWTKQAGRERPYGRVCRGSGRRDTRPATASPAAVRRLTPMCSAPTGGRHRGTGPGQGLLGLGGIPFDGQPIGSLALDWPCVVVAITPCHRPCTSPLPLRFVVVVVHRCRHCM